MMTVPPATLFIYANLQHNIQFIVKNDDAARLKKIRKMY